jgi:DNA-binding NarL/FixJ family response regulator
VRVLLIEDDQGDAQAIRRALGERYDIRVEATLAEALLLLRGRSWRPEVIIADISLPDSQGPATVEALQGVARGAPVIVSTGIVTETLRRQVDALGAVRVQDKHEGYVVLRALLQQQATFQHSLATSRAELLAEIDKVARRAAEIAVSQAMGRLLERLGLGDEEGVRMAVRLARGWDAAKSRFLGTLATGIASAVLLALAAGLIAMIRTGGAR